MAEIKFYANIKTTNENAEIKHTEGSGIGFYGAGFGVAVPVGSQQSSTFVTNSSGTTQGSQLNNTALYSSGDALTQGQVRVNGGNAINLANLPNYLCPLNIRFTHTEPVAVQNCKLRVFDRNNIDKAASGVTTWVFEARHPATVQEAYTLDLRSADFQTGQYYWKEFDTNSGGSELLLTSSPGISGTNTSVNQSLESKTTYKWETASGISHTSTTHDWYVALSSEPESVGSKVNYGLYFTAEYL